MMVVMAVHHLAGVQQTVGILLANGGLVAHFPAEVADGQLLGEGLILAQLGTGRQLEAWMHMLAVPAIGTEAGQIVHAEDAAHVPMATVWSMAAEATVVPWTVLDLALRIDVQERTLLVVAGIEARIEVALGHLLHVEFMEKLTLVALLAEAAQPVLADDGAIAPDVPERTHDAIGALRAVLRVQELADGCH